MKVRVRVRWWKVRGRVSGEGEVMEGEGKLKVRVR